MKLFRQQKPNHLVFNLFIQDRSRWTCIPVDPYYLSWVAKKNKIKTNLIYQAGKINSMMPNWIISNIIKGRNIKKVLIIGVAYKNDVDDTRESPAIDFIRELSKKKIHVDFFDPNVKILKSRKLKKTYRSKNINSKILKKYNCVIILANHSDVNYNLINKYSNLIIDTRNVYKNETDKIIKL